MISNVAMPTTDLDRYIAARLLHADLSAIDALFNDDGIADMAGIVCLKNTFLALANMVDFEKNVRDIYKDHQTLSAVFSENLRNFEFAKYLRNKFVGHIHSGLIEKAIEWKPELRYLAAQMDDPKIMLLVNIFVLEAAINTYVGEDGKHKVFESDTDLAYPPDWKRFVAYLEVSISSAIHYLGDLCGVLSAGIDHPASDHFDLELWAKAGRTDFAFLKK